MISLQDRVCLITGAARGIGRAIAEGFARRGAVVAAADLHPPELTETRLNLSWNVADAAQAEAAVAQTVERFGRIDALVANAGIYPQKNWDQIESEEWRRILGINLDGAWFGAQAAARAMKTRGYGKIVLVSSIEVEFGPASHVHYTTSKAGIIGLTRSLARAAGRDGIRVNAVMPGAILTRRRVGAVSRSEYFEPGHRRETVPAGAGLAIRCRTDFCLFLLIRIGRDYRPGTLRG